AARPCGRRGARRGRSPRRRGDRRAVGADRARPAAPPAVGVRAAAARGRRALRRDAVRPRGQRFEHRRSPPLPARARGAARSRGRAGRARARRARGGSAAPNRPREDRAPARGLARPALAAHGRPHRDRRAPQREPAPDRRGPRGAARCDRRRLRAAAAARRRPARPLAARGRQRPGGARGLVARGHRARRGGGARRARLGRDRRRGAARRGRRDAGPARAREPDRERAQVLAARNAGDGAADGDAQGGDRPRRRPRPRPRAGGARARLRAVLPARRRHALRRGARPRDRARLRGRERRAALGGVPARPGRDVRARASRRRGARGAPGMTGRRVLVVDDEPQILRALRATLRGAGYTVDAAATVEEALTAAAAHPPEAVILDLILPDGNGTEVTRELRSWSEAPVIVLSAVGEESEKIAALDAGADDYVTKPFSVDELLARLRAVLRRRTDAQSEPVIEIGELRVDVPERVVTVEGRRVKLSPHEFDLLRVLAQN